MPALTFPTPVLVVLIVVFVIYLGCLALVIGCNIYDWRLRRRRQRELDHHFRTAPVTDPRYRHAMGGAFGDLHRPEPHLGKRRLP
jgi:hypothetical protein